MKSLGEIISDKGNFREKNQDRAIYLEGQVSGRQLILGCLCDGVGSLKDSELSSECVIRSVSEWFSTTTSIREGIVTRKALVDSLIATIKGVNSYVYTQRKTAGIEMSCTLSAVLIYDGYAEILNAGDSRIYSFSSDGLLCLTNDDTTSVVRNDKVKFVLSNYIGKGEAFFINNYSESILTDTTYFVACDGFYKCFSEKDARKVFEANAPEEIKTALVQAVNNIRLQGEKDNCTCVAINLKGSMSAPQLEDNTEDRTMIL